MEERDERKNLAEVVGKLACALALGQREHVALVGGGGKTTLLFALASELQKGNRSVVTTTTTKMRHREALQSGCVIFVQQCSTWQEKLFKALREKGHVFLADRLLDNGKVEGIRPALADALFQGRQMDYLLVEADGSAGHPVKAPVEHEPVIPQSTTKTVALMGAEAVGQEAGPERVFRMDRFQELTGLEAGQKMDASHLSRVILDPEGLFKGSPASARRVLLLNKRDMLKEEREVRALARFVMRDPSNRVDRVVIGSIHRGIYTIEGRGNESNLQESDRTG